MASRYDISPNGYSSEPGPGDYEPDRRAHRTKSGNTRAMSAQGREPQQVSPTSVYNPMLNSVIKCPASWTIPKSSRQVVDPRDIPGPATYFEQVAVRRPGGYSAVSTSVSAPAYGFAGRYSAAMDRVSPGPSEYNPSIKALRRSAPAFSLSGRTQPQSARSRTPGPADYYPDPVPVLRSSPKCTIAERLDRPPDRDRKPGPADYEPPIQGRRSPGVSHKFRYKQHTHESTPGPQDYYHQPRARSPAFSFRMKTKPPRSENCTPGPGAYETHSSTFGRRK